MELTIIILGIIIYFGFCFFKSRNKKDKLQDWKPHE